MKISELKNAPSWLIEAITIDADIEIIDGYVIWRDGTWQGGTWRGGFWQGGTWKGGTWRGGTWLGGTWLGGTWLGGFWRGGVWEGGTTSIKSKYIMTITDSQIKIGCKTKSIEDWDLWFAGSEEFETKRGTKEFAMIEANYKAIKAYKQHLDKFDVAEVEK